DGVVIRVGAGHSAVLVERGAGQPEAARADAPVIPPGAWPGSGTRPEHADRSPEPGRGEGRQGEGAARAVSVAASSPCQARLCRRKGTGPVILGVPSPLFRAL